MMTPDLVWVAVEDRIVIAVLAAFIGHKIFNPFRIVSMKNAPYRCMHRLIITAFRDAMYRGCHYWCAQIDDPKLAKIVMKRGGSVSHQNWYGGVISALIKEKPKMKLVDAVRFASGVC